MLCSSNTLSGLLKKELETEAQTKGFQAVYAETNLGFVLEQKSSMVNSLKYLSEGEVVGECVWLSASKNKLNKICEKLGLVITNKYVLEDKCMIEGYSALLNYFIDGTNNNIQIASYDEKIIIGSPIIYGSY